MNNKNTWPFDKNKQVHGMRLPEYLTWATGDGQHENKLLLPPIQRGFVWKSKQIVDLWDSLLRGMPIGSLMVSKLSKGQEASHLTTKKTEDVSSDAMGLLDGQQRTLAILIGWPSADPSPHCLWIDLAEEGYAGSPFEIRLTTQAQPFGFHRVSQARLSRHERREARKNYDKSHPAHHLKFDYELFSAHIENEQPRPWKANNIGSFIRVKDAWRAFLNSEHNKAKFINTFNIYLRVPLAQTMLSRLYDAFTCMDKLEVPLILIPDHINASRPESLLSNVPDPLVLLFERIGRNGAGLTAEDLLFSMIKQQWPKAQELINHSNGLPAVRSFMGASDYVMTAFRLAAAQNEGKSIADTPRPNPNDFHRHLGTLLGKEGETNRPLRNYIKKDSHLTLAFEMLHDVLLYRGDQDIGFPLLMMPHLSRGLIQVLLLWIMRNGALNLSEINREKIISFSLYWYLHVWHEDKASKAAFTVINSTVANDFPANRIYEVLIAAHDDEFGLSLPLVSCNELRDVLNQEASASLRSHDAIFKTDNSGKPIATAKQRELYKRFCWSKKPLLLWLQRAYVREKFGEQTAAEYAGLTDEETVPYDYDHLCPQNHWGADWRHIIKAEMLDNEEITAFSRGRNGVGNCIGNLHVLESSLNRSLGDDALASKLKSDNWTHQDSLLYHIPEHESLWQQASHYGDYDTLRDDIETTYKTWDGPRLQAFQSAVYFRALGLYGEYVKACEHIMQKSTSE